MAVGRSQACLGQHRGKSGLQGIFSAISHGLFHGFTHAVIALLAFATAIATALAVALAFSFATSVAIAAALVIAVATATAATLAAVPVPASAWIEPSVTVHVGAVVLLMLATGIAVALVEARGRRVVLLVVGGSTAVVVKEYSACSRASLVGLHAFVSCGHACHEGG